MKLGILFAGQGSQKIGMGMDFYEQYESFRKVFDLLTDKEKKIAWEGPSELLSDTENTQPIMVAYALGIYKCLRDENILPYAGAGLSLGEYSALASSGVFNEETAVELVRLRGKKMKEASMGIDCKMSAILGIERDILEQCCEEASEGEIVSIANLNCPGQIVIGGKREAVERAEELAAEKGAKRSIPLSVSGPFHTAYMKPAGEALAKAFDSINMGDMSYPVLFNCVGRVKKQEEKIEDLLIVQVSNPVRFEDSINNMIKMGVDHFLEIGPGRALGGFVKKVDRKMKVTSIETVDEFIETVNQFKEEAK